MSEHSGSPGDPVRLCLEAGRAALAAVPISDRLRARCGEMFDAWQRFAEVYEEAAHKTGRSPAGQGAATSPFDPLAWMDMGAGGGLGDLWRLFAGAAALSDPLAGLREGLLASRHWAAYTAALERFRAIMAGAWARAWQRFAEAAGRDGDSLPPERMAALWQEAADTELALAMRSEEFLAAQRALIRARLDCMAAIRRQGARLADFLGLATAAEVEALATRLHALERQLGQRDGGTG